MSLSKEELIKSLRANRNNIKQQVKEKRDTLHCCMLSKDKLPSQSWSTLLETHIRNKFNLIKIPKEEECGDCYWEKEKKKEIIEIKISLGGTEKYVKFHFVQLRPHHNIHYYLFLCYDQTVGEFGEYYYFKIPKNIINDLLPEYGGYAHSGQKSFGKITTESIKEHMDKKVEYSLRPKKGSRLWNELLKWKVEDESKMFE